MTSLNTTHFVRKLGHIFDEHLTFQTIFRLFPNPAIIIFVNVAPNLCSKPYSLAHCRHRICSVLGNALRRFSI